MTVDSSQAQKPDGFEVLATLSILKDISEDFDDVDDNIDYHVASSFFKIRAFEYRKSEIVDDYANGTCHYAGELHRNFASAFLYDGGRNVGLGIDWVARSSIKDYDMTWRGKHLLAGDEKTFRMKLYASNTTVPGSRNEPYLFEGTNKYVPSGKLCCSELPLLNAIDAVGNGLDLIGHNGIFTDSSVLVVMTERIPCYSCRANIVRFLEENKLKKLRVYYMFDSLRSEVYETSDTLLSFFAEHGIDAVVARVKFIAGVDRNDYDGSPDEVRFSIGFNPFNQPDRHVYASLHKLSLEQDKAVRNDAQFKFDPDTTPAHVVTLNMNSDVGPQAVDFFENEYFSNNRFDLFDAKDVRRKKKSK